MKGVSDAYCVLDIISLLSWRKHGTEEMYEVNLGDPDKHFDVFLVMISVAQRYYILF